MAYYNFHAKAQNLIKTGHCVGAEVVEEYHHISPALILYFDNHMPMPIRLHKFEKYFELLSLYNVSMVYKK